MECGVVSQVYLLGSEVLSPIYVVQTVLKCVKSSANTSSACRLDICSISAEYFNVYWSKLNEVT
jgi:hypothetical protein